MNKIAIFIKYANEQAKESKPNRFIKDPLLAALLITPTTLGTAYGLNELMKGKNLYHHHQWDNPDLP